MTDEIRVFEPNLLGEDKIIGDVHGNSECLKAVIDTLGPHDRLFIVGDLTDRGHDNLGVMRLLRDNPNKIVSIRGNHETLCLQAITGLENIYLTKKPDVSFRDETWLSVEDFRLDSTNIKQGIPKLYQKYGESGANSVFIHIINGGDWLITLFKKEVQDGKIILQEHQPDNISIVYSPDSEVKMIKDMMNDLPYIIHVKGDKPFHAVHADMPMDDKELSNRIMNGNGLTDEEKYYATWARDLKDAPDPMVNRGRTKDSTPTFVGHNMIDKGKAAAFRENTNTYNLDVGTYANNVSLVVNVTKGVADFIDISIFKGIFVNFKRDISLEQILPQLKAEAQNMQISFFILHKEQLSLLAFSSVDGAYVLTELGPLSKMGPVTQYFQFPKEGERAILQTLTQRDFPENFPYWLLQDRKLFSRPIISPVLNAAREIINKQLALIPSKDDMEEVNLVSFQFVERQNEKGQLLSQGAKKHKLDKSKHSVAKKQKRSNESALDEYGVNSAPVNNTQFGSDGKRVSEDGSRTSENKRQKR